MGQYVITLLFIFLTSISLAKLPSVSVHDIPGIEGASLEVRFTNPKCIVHDYEEEVFSNDGALLLAKPEGAYCAGSLDFSNSFTWEDSPRQKLIEWVKDPQTKEIFFAFQTITDGGVLGAICEEIKSRNIKVTFVLSRNRNYLEDGSKEPLIDLTKAPVIETESTQSKYDRVIRKLTSCGETPGNLQPVGILRGHTGSSEGNSIGWAHNKFFVVNPNDSAKIKFATGSGNLTSAGVATNHENWLFFDNIPQNTYLAQSVQCMRKMQIDDKAHFSKSNFIKMNEECLKNIDPSFKKAQGIESFYIPGDGKRAIDQYLIPAFSESKKITVATHLLGFPRLFVRGMTCAASKKPSSSCYKKNGSLPGFKKTIGKSEVRLITDDDIHWLMVGQYDENGKVGYNDLWEAGNAEEAERGGAKLKFVQTSHHGPFKQLHHSKLIVFEKNKTEAVWTGAGNLTMPAMYTNFENYYYITIPTVVEAYKMQLDGMWSELATAKESMPKLDVVPLKDPVVKEEPAAE